MTAAPTQHQDAAASHPRDTRYGISVELEFHLVRRGKVVQTGIGRTMNLSSSGVLFESDTGLPPGMPVQLWIRWPVRLDNEVSLNLFVIGRTIRTEGNCTAVRFQRHEFRIRAARRQSSLSKPLVRAAGIVTGRLLTVASA